MEIRIYTDNPSELRRIIFEKIENEEFKTWHIREIKGRSYLTHSGQWEDSAFLDLVIAEDELNVKIVFWTNQKFPDSYTQGIYLGRFTEALLNHFNQHYNSFEIFY